ncbi:RluA family pseudouridine synthase [Patescibacteria group bacterium]|nr:RluA family pseudouridine synthase [Patescibacteria group bacterium]
MPQNFKFEITKENQGSRLDKFLAGKMPEYSRAWLQKLIKEKDILVNPSTSSGQAAIKASYKLKTGDSVVGKVFPPPEISIAPDPEIKFKVVYEDKDFAVIEKPAGLVVHPSASHKKKTLVNGLLARWPEIKNVGENPLRPGIVHRLDKDTSGLMIIVKNNEAFFYFKNLFKNRQIEKKYLALVFGKIKPPEGLIDIAISRSKTIPARQAAAKTGEKSRKAVTYYKALKYFIDDAGAGYTLLEAAPKTGRMHQIRVHFFTLGHGIAGDKVYKKRRMSGFARSRVAGKLVCELSRHFLHANFLGFVSPSGKNLEFISSLPEELKNFLEKLKPANAPGLTPLEVRTYS